jgi:glycosyltransferase involved in cell wall biosynthesis
MKFSIIMPVLDGEEFIADALTTLKMQSYENFEVIIVDGGSTDGTEKIVTKFLLQDSRFKLIALPGSGIYDSILHGISQSSGDVLSWLNSDDLYTHWALASVQQYLSKYLHVSWVMGLPGVWDRNGILQYVLPISSWPRSWIHKGYFHPNLLGCIQAESCFFKKKLFEKISMEKLNKIRESKFAGDYLLWRALAEHTELKGLPTLIGGFRNHGDNLSIKNENLYMNEVYASGTINIPPRIGRRLGQIFQASVSVRTYFKAIRCSVSLNLENARRFTGL